MLVSKRDRIMTWVVTGPQSMKRTGLRNGTSGMVSVIGMLTKVMIRLREMLIISAGTTGLGTGLLPTESLRTMAVSIHLLCQSDM
jgi:hypothetical protein